jgi:hypothetical protein
VPEGGPDVRYRRWQEGRDTYGNLYRTHDPEPVFIAVRYLRAMVLLHDTWRGSGELSRLLSCSRGSLPVLVRQLASMGYHVERRRFAGAWMYRRAAGASCGRR